MNETTDLLPALPHAAEKVSLAGAPSAARLCRERTLMKPARDRTKLPLWAQSELTRLERDLKSAYAKLSSGPEDSDTFADSYSAVKRPLGHGPNIEFVFGKKWGERFIVRLENERLVVAGGDGIVVHPRASNSIEIGMRL